MKKYAVVVDVSPSEQINDNDDEIKIMALVFGLNSPRSFDEVGSDYPDPEHKFALKKWSSASDKYKAGFVKHARILADSGNIIFGSNIASNTVIRDVGFRYWELLMGKMPSPSSVNKKKRPRVLMGGYKVDGKLTPKYEVLIDDLIVIGWYAESLASCLKGLVEVNGEEVKLDILIDNLPNEQGGEDYFKATLLREVCRRATNGLLNVVGVPEHSDTMQRELLVDNMAGLLSEINSNDNSKYQESLSLYRFNRKTA